MQQLQAKSAARLRVEALARVRARAISNSTLSAVYWRKLEPVVHSVGNEEQARLKCTLCHTLLSASNVSRTGTEHYKGDGSCRGLTTLAGKRRYAAMMDQGALDEHLVHPLPPASLVIALKELSLFFYTTNTPLHLVEDPHLQACLEALGVEHEDLLSRKQLSTTVLDAEFVKEQQKLSANLEALDLINLCTDGWKKRSAAQGANLSNCMVLPPAGGSLFFDVHNTTGHKKDKHYLADHHLGLLDRASNGIEDKQNSVVMDNTSANRAAMGIIKEQRPWVIALGCAVSPDFK